MGAENPEQPGAVIVPALPKGLQPQAVSELFFQACEADDYHSYLATLHIDARSNATTPIPGPFESCHWEEGRSRVEKYRVTYEYLGQSNSGVKANERFVTLRYRPLYGHVPGYQQGKALGVEISLELREQGGPGGEWRVAEGAF